MSKDAVDFVIHKITEHGAPDHWRPGQVSPSNEMLGLHARVVAARTGGGVERCHGIRHDRSYNNAAHSWGALMLLWQLWPEDWARLGPVLLAHDVPEFVVGDSPAPMKRYCPGAAAEMDVLERAVLAELRLPDDSGLDDEDRAKIKACDLLELLLWAHEEVAAGNQHAVCVIRELRRFFQERPLPPRAALLASVVELQGAVHASDGFVHRLARKHLEQEREGRE